MLNQCQLIHTTTVVTSKMRLPHTHPPLNAFKNDQDSWPEKKKPIID
jgi:hypothetical protein